MSKRRPHREKNLTHRLLSGDIDDMATEQRFSRRSAGAEQSRIERTALLRAAEEAATGDIAALPAGQVVQVYSLFFDVEAADGMRLCVVRKTLMKVLDTPIVTGDFVRFRETGNLDETGRPEAVIENLLPRQTLLTRADSFKAITAQPIVANAQQMLIVASLVQPEVKWGLIDRMIIAAQAGGLKPIFCLNKIDLADSKPSATREMAFAQQAIAHYAGLGVATIQASVPAALGLQQLRDSLRDRTTVLAGHSGVGKSSLINSIQPLLDLRVGAISGYTGKGRHTTSSARRYTLDFGGQVIDTPGVKLFGLWGVTPDNLLDFFPDIANETAPDWRRESYARILQSIGAEQA
jgi:ribosome biogenesis GTPase / thiamine phosphate phosphatase